MQQAAARSTPARTHVESWHWWFATAIVALVLVAVLAFVALNRSAAAAADVDHTRQVIASIDALLRDHQDAETGQRGFLITGDPAFLKPYEDAAPRIAGSLATLQSITSASDENQGLVQRIQDLSQRKLDELAHTLDLVRAGDRDAAVRTVARGEGKLIMDEIRSIVVEMRDAEAALLIQRTSAAQAARRASVLMMVGGVSGAFALVGLAGLVQRQFAMRRKELGRAIAERRAAEASGRESEEKFRVIADTMPQIVWSTKSDGYHDYFNERWYEYTGMPRPHEPGGEFDSEGTGQGWNWSQHLHPEDLQRTKEVWERSLASGEPYFVEYRIRHRDGHYRWFIGRALALRDEAGAITRWFGTSTDIEDQKKAMLEREQVLAAERTARSHAERAARMKDEFVATLSHELRTPLNAILGWAHILRGDRTEPSINKALEVIERNTRLQSQMVEDLLDTSRILSGKMRLDIQRMDVLPVLEAAIDSVKSTADAKGVTIVTVFGSGGTIQGDPSRVQQITWNLLSNAIKFTPRGGKVKITHRKSGSHIEFSVSDTGQGIKPQFLPHVFERFRQEDASITRRTGGLGLGLSIVKHLVEMHGGLVEAYSEGEGRGATFSVRLPLAAVRMVDRDPAPHEGSVAPARGVLRGLQVLVVDDEPDARELVKRVLEEAGAEVSIAGSAQEGIATVSSGLRPDVVVSDIGMPEQDGYDFIRRFRQVDGAGTAPAAALTALARSEDRKRALLAGFQTHVAKPVDPVELVTVVASLSGRLGPGR